MDAAIRKVNRPLIAALSLFSTARELSAIRDRFVSSSMKPRLHGLLIRMEPRRGRKEEGSNRWKLNRYSWNEEEGFQERKNCIKKEKCFLLFENSLLVIRPSKLFKFCLSPDKIRS